VDNDTKAEMIEALKIYLTNPDKSILVEALRAITNLSRESTMYDCITDELVLKSLNILIHHVDTEVVYWVLAIIVNISCH